MLLSSFGDVLRAVLGADLALGALLEVLLEGLDLLKTLILLEVLGLLEALVLGLLGVLD